jgi:hypothetical protein
MCFQSLAVTHNKSLINFMQKYFALSPPPPSLGPTAERRKIREAAWTVFYSAQLRAHRKASIGGSCNRLTHRMPQ